MPALPLDDAGPYVAAAYLVFLALVLIYVAIMAAKLGRIEREIGELAELVDRRGAERAENTSGGAPDGSDAGTVPPRADAGAVSARTEPGHEPTEARVP
jgi:hypothetical protein